MVDRGFYTNSLVGVFCEETLRFACQSGSARLAKMAGPAMLSTEVGPGMGLQNRDQGGTYRGTARQVAAGPRGRRAEVVVSGMRLRTQIGASSSRRSQRGGEPAWERPGCLRCGMRRGMGMIRACVGHARVMMYRGGACAGSNGVCMWFMSLCCSKLVYESIVLASSAVSMGMNVFRTRFDIHTIQELMACAPGKLCSLPD